MQAAAPDATASVLALIAAMLCEMRGEGVPQPAPDDELEQGLGIDSLARMELMLRMERAFGVRMPQSLVEQARTPADLVRALAAASPREAGAAPAPGPAGATRAALPVGLPDRAATLVDVLHWHAMRGGDRLHIGLMADDDDLARHSVPSLLARAEALAAGLQAWGLEPGETVGLMLPTGMDFFEAFSGILLAGGVPVPIYPPLRLSQVEDHLRRQAGILDNAGAVHLICDMQTQGAARILHAGVTALRGVSSVQRLLELGGRFHPVLRGTHDIAMLQYTSGSTGQPKGVVLTHANLLANLRAMGRALRATPDDVFVSWLPLYHDMGLIGAWMGSLYHGVALHVMPPQAFLARPARWLRAIHRHRGTLSAAPNFAYEILATKVLDDELRGLDLSCWRAALNGAEPVHASTLERFSRRMAPHGFDPRALMPVYGLAECGVGIAFPPLGRLPRIDTIDRARLRTDGVAQAVRGVDASRTMQVVACGLALPGHEIRIVDAQGSELPERHEGRVELRGPSATAGYFRQEDATRALRRGDWLDSGDLGYVAEGELFLTSRAKDLIKRGGHNIHPYDLEDAVAQLPGVRRGGVAVFGASDPASSTERIVVLAETSLVDAAQRRALRERIAELALAVLEAPADDVVLAAPRTVLKTSSGKIRRAACREMYEQGRLDAPARAVAWQLASLWRDALGTRLRRAMHGAVELAYATWVWVLVALGALTSVGAAALPGRSRRQRSAHAIAHAVVRASGLAVRVNGAGHLVARPALYVANHASYADWLILMAMLPAGVGFVAKRELARHAAMRWVLERMGTRFVEREDLHASVEDAQSLVDAARHGESLVFFPEGTLVRAPGVRGFHLGAFVAAAQAGVAVVPVSLRGTRSLLRDGSWLPRRQRVDLTVHPPMRAPGAGWTDVLKLRDAARARIASACGEPQLPA